MSFIYPFYFWLILLILPLFIKRDFREFSVRFYGYLLTALFIIIALSRPVIEQKPIESKQILGDVIIGVDLSYSMQTDDIKPTRLSYAKEMLEKMVRVEQKSRFAILGFTTNAIVLSPLTQDRELLLHLFGSLDEKLILTKGSDIMSALKLSRKMSDSKKATVVIFTDGADKLNYDEEARFAKENNLVVDIFMSASAMGGTMRLKNGELLKDELEDIVVSRENDAVKKISDVTGGIYTKDIDKLLDALDSQRSKEKEGKITVMKNLELFYYFIFLAIVSFLLSVTTLKRYVVSFLLLLGVHVNASQNMEYFNKATEYYRSGEYEKALESYQMVRSSDPKTKSIIFYDIGNSLVRLKEFEKAKEAYLKSLTLYYSKEADENMEHIKDAPKNKEMNTGSQESKKRSALAKKEQSSKKQKEGGGSNMRVSALSGGGADDGGKKVRSQNMLNLNKGKAKLSSKQYELINKRGVSEKTPW